MAKEKPQRGKKKVVAPANDWLVQEDIRSDVEDPSKVHRRGKNIRRAIYAGPVLAFVSLALTASMNSSMGAMQESVNSMDREVKVDSPGKSQATIALNEWLGAAAKPLPNAKVLSWDGREVMQEYSLTLDEETNSTVETLGREVHRFTLVNGTGLVYKASVITVDAPGRGATVVGTPSMMPEIPVASSSLVGTNWMNLTPSQSTDNLKTAVDAWASAYTSGDPMKLRQVTGDPKATNSYMPLLQIESATATINSSGTNEEFDEKDQAVVSVSLSVQWKGVKYDESSSSLPTLSYDLLLEKVSTASPVVVAWTDAGLGESLTPYSNAAQGLDITTNQDSVSVAVNEASEGAE